ncbi:hypothetical protein IKF33_01065 [Candidatus Saccharibacteria bacterium]|nr:hypothetical protein [Candidatus Saccharibacteria bacterium]
MLHKVIIKSIITLTIISGVGVAFMPLTSEATTCSLSTAVTGTTSASCDIPIYATVGQAISITISPDPVSITAVPGGPIATASVSTTVVTNTTAGYTVGLYTVDEGGNYPHSPALEPSAGNVTLPAGVPTVGSSYWGVKGGNGAYASTYVGLQKNTPTIFYTAAAGSYDIHDTSTTTHAFTVGASASTVQPAGTYTGKIQAIATTAS